MAQQPPTNQSTPLLAPDPLHLTMEQQVEGREPRTVSASPTSNTVIRQDASLSSSASSRSSTTLQVHHEDEHTPLLLSASQDSTVQQQHEGRDSDGRANLTSARVENDSTMHSSTEQHHEHISSSFSASGESSPIIEQIIQVNSASNTFKQQVAQLRRTFSLFDPTQSSIMLRRNTRAESASAARSSTSQQTLHHLNPKRVKRLINTLGLDEQRSDMLYRLVIATAPFHNNESELTAPEENDPRSDTLREALGSLMFAPNSANPIRSQTATTGEEGSIADVTPDNPIGNLPDANAAESHESRPLEPRSEAPPLLWSTAAAEESLDPDAEDPTYFTVAEFINTIIEKEIQVESVTDDDWWIEEVRVAILNRLTQDASEENLSDEEEPREEPKEVVVPKEEPVQQAKVKEDTSQSDLQRWKEQGPSGWLERADGTDMNDEEMEDEFARWDAVVRNARNEKEAEKVIPSLGPNIDLKDNGFWKFVRSSKQKEQTQGSISTHGQNEKASVSANDQVEKASQKKNKKGSNKNKNKNRKAKKNVLKRGDAGDVSEEVRDTEIPFNFLELPTEARNKVLGFVLVVDQKLVPYCYIKGKVVKDIGLRKKPGLNILLALCSSKDTKVKRCLDDAKNILYRDNTFLIRKPTHFIMFLAAIGGDNVARLKMGKNLMVADTFFDKKRQYALEWKWLARWGKHLLFTMKGHNIIRSDIAAESSEDDLICEPTEVEKALKSMVEVMKGEIKMHEMLQENEDGSRNNPMRLQSLDFGEKFDSLAEQINTMGLAVGEVGEVTTADTAETPVTNAPEEIVESMGEKWKRKALEAGKKGRKEGDADRYSQLFLKMIANLDTDDEEEILSEDSGYYTPSVYSEADEAGVRGKASSKSTSTLESNSQLAREIMVMMDAAPFGASE